MNNFKENDYVIYENGDTLQLGKIKRIADDGAFVWYHSGDTASKTPFHLMRKLENDYVIKETELGHALWISVKRWKRPV